MAAPDIHNAHPQHSDPHLDELLAGHVLGDLDEGERQQLREALAGDPQLQRQLDELRLTLELLPMALPDAANPPARIRRRLLGSQTNLRQPPSGGRPWQWPLRPAQLGMAGIACGMVALGSQVMLLQGEMANLRQQRTPSSQPGPYQQASRTLALRATGGRAGITGQVVVNPGEYHNLLIVRGLPPAPPNQIYRLWANVNGKTKGCVRFLPNADGSVAIPIPTQPSSEAQAVSITLEPLRNDGSYPDGPQLLTSV
jgi:hypothetical protein